MPHHHHTEDCDHDHEHDIYDPRDELVTVRDLLRYAVSQFNRAKLFFGHGSDNAYDEAVYLILHTLHLPLDTLEPFLDACIPSNERTEVLNIIERRITERIPAAYLTQEAWLGNFRFFVDERVIVPRSYFAELLQDNFSPWVHDSSSISSALDLCTGSACLAILLAYNFENAEVDAIDLSPEALAVAQRNVADYQLQQRVHCIQSDLFSAVGEKRYDLIISNPPYVTAESMASLPAEYRHEPALALGAGEDGLDIVRRIIAEAKQHLTEHGLLAIEIGHNQDIVERAFPKLEFTWLCSEQSSNKVFLLRADQLP